MPRLSCYFIRSALLFLAAGFTLGAIMLGNKGFPIFPGILALLPIHIEFLLIGWFVQLAFGVAYWILPRFGKVSSRGNPGVAWFSFGLLNLGILSVVLGFFLPSSSLAILGRLMESFGTIAFIFAVWKRVKPFAV